MIFHTDENLGLAQLYGEALALYAQELYMSSDAGDHFFMRLVGGGLDSFVLHFRASI